jgi:putative transposase
MARLARYFLPDQPLHLIQRGNNRSAIFFAPHDYALFRLWLGEAAAAHACAIHAYVLMTNHFHLVATPSRADSLPRMMQSLGRRYVQHVNRTQRRTGTLWEGRCRATPVDAEAYFFACCHYVEDNPVRARMVAAPADYVWSSYRRNTLEAADPLVVEHKPYTALGADAAARREAYRALFRRLDEAALRRSGRRRIKAGRLAMTISARASRRKPAAAPKGFRPGANAKSHRPTVR